MAESIETKRRLAAIFAADVEGYSRLMGADEVATLEELTARRKILDAMIAKHGGRIANTAGDSVLAEFGSAVDAVRCAMEAQVALAKANSTLTENRQVNFRMGVHVGDVMVRAGDLFGDGVNIAARLQTLAKAGGLCISGVTYDKVRKVLPLEFTDLGTQTVKNIEEPVRAYEVKEHAKATSALTKVFPDGGRKAIALPDKPSIAVLPFQNMSGDPEQDYFADGLSEDITTALSRFKSLFVIARNSSFSYKGKSPDIREVGRELGVRYVLEGSVRKSANRVRITGQLIDTLNGTHLWADRFDGALDDVFSLQDTVTEKVGNAIALRVEQADIERSKNKSTDSLDAYDFHLRGVARLNLIMVPGTEPKLTITACREARELFLRATELDPDFARAYASAALTYVIETQTAGPTATNRSEMVADAVRVSRRAASLGKDDAIVLSHAGQTLAYLANQIDEGSSLIERAIVLNPNLSLAWNFGGWIKIFAGEPDTAIERFARAIRLSPLDPYMFLLQLGTACGHLFAGDHEQAAMWAARALQERPNIGIALRIAAVCFAVGGRLGEAKKAVAQLRELAPGFRIAHTRTMFPLRRPEDLAKYIEGLRLAGVPE